MGVEESFEEEPAEESSEEEEEKEPKKTIKKPPRRNKTSVNEKELIKKPKKLEIKKTTLETLTEIEEEIKEKEPSFIKVSEEKENKISSSPASDIKENKEKWLNFDEEDEGELAVDIYQTEKELVIQSAIAGVKPENLDIALEKDILTVRGMREKPFNEKADYFCRECYWGPFSREIILPAEIDPGQPVAKMKEGVLTIRIPKIIRGKKRKVIITE